MSEEKINLDPRVTLATNRWLLARGLGARVLTLTAEVRDLQHCFTAMESRFTALKGRVTALESSGDHPARRHGAVFLASRKNGCRPRLR
jgi:hypothetical protein